MTKPTLKQRVQSTVGEALWELGAAMRWSWAMRWGWSMVSRCITERAEQTGRFDPREYDA